MINKSVVTLLAVAMMMLGCAGVPNGLTPVSGFDPDRYLGKWYEIARLDHSFEKNMSNVTAIYSRDDAGGISVTNRGYDEKAGEWKQIEGRANFIEDESVGSLKVSFFGPFYGGYHIIALDQQNYNYSMVTGPSRSYLWILSRNKFLDGSIYLDLVSKAREWGFDTAEFIKVEHDRTDG